LLEGCFQRIRGFISSIVSYFRVFTFVSPVRCILRRIFGPKRDEVTGGCRQLHNEELRDLYSSPSVIRMADEVGGACSPNGGKEKCV
jgi:hypothetical protein